MSNKQLDKQKFKVQNEKKLNKGRSPGFRYDISQIYNEDITTIMADVSTEELLNSLDYEKNYIGEMYPKQFCICISCDVLTFKLLNPKTLWLYEPYHNQYIVFYRYDEYEFKHLKDSIHSDRMMVSQTCIITFTKTTLPKFCPKWSEYKLATLPQLTTKEIEQILSIDGDLYNNNGYYYPINKFTDKYRIPQTVCGILAKHVIPMNTRVVLERLLQVMSHSSAILDNSELEQPYWYDFKLFSKDLKFTGRKAMKQDIIIKSLENLARIGLIDSFSLNNNKLIFTTHLITKHIRQQIKRNLGYYAQIPKSKQAPFIATFIDYLWWIINCPAGYKKITICLETLFNNNLGLSRLLEEHRNSEIAKILNTLRNIGQQYGLLDYALNTQDITSADVKYLLNNRTKLHTFLQIKTSNNEVKEEK